MIIDSHCHLHDAVYADARQTLRVALTYDVWGVVGVGCDPASNEKTLAAAAVLPKAIWAWEKSACRGTRSRQTLMHWRDGTGGRPTSTGC